MKHEDTENKNDSDMVMFSDTTKQNIQNLQNSGIFVSTLNEQLNNVDIIDQEEN